jgi:cobalt-precorrin-5B (C1)-methyltransferase
MKNSELRKGWTTGACAAAAAKAAFVALHSGAFPDPVTIRLPQGQIPAFSLARADLAPGRATAGVVKDAGDDPDVTHGALILASVEPSTGGIQFRAGAGVGTVTLPGLPLAVGEPAINPGPRAQIAANIEDAAAQLGVPPNAIVTVSIPEGERLAERTLNARLGILGGLSILGTTGVVLPYSCSAWVHSIHRGIDVARALGIRHLGAATGKTSEALLRRRGLSDQALIDMGDMAGAVLKYLRSHPVERLTLAGGFAKLVKLAAGEMDLHSRVSQVDMDFLSRLAGHRLDCASAAQALAAVPELGEVVAYRARETALAVLAGGTGVEVIAIDRAGKVVGQAG